MLTQFSAPAKIAICCSHFSRLTPKNYKEGRIRKLIRFIGLRFENSSWNFSHKITTEKKQLV